MTLGAGFTGDKQGWGEGGKMEWNKMKLKEVNRREGSQVNQVKEV